MSHFRAKRKRGGGWVEGALLTLLPDDPKIVYLTASKQVSSTSVQEHTIGQYIDLTDKNGKMAFVGDIFKDSGGVVHTIFTTKGGFATESHPMAFGYGSQRGSNPTIALSDSQAAAWFMDSCEIIGNIYDNLDLLQ